MGMGCYLGVAEASLQPPAFIHLTYKPPGEAKKKVRRTVVAKLAVVRDLHRQHLLTFIRC
jgi:hypothetical protein